MRLEICEYDVDVDMYVDVGMVVGVDVDMDSHPISDVNSMY